MGMQGVEPPRHASDEPESPADILLRPLDCIYSLPTHDDIVALANLLLAHYDERQALKQEAKG